MTVQPRAVLFDLGGVFIKLGGVVPMIELSGLGDGTEVWRRWLTSPRVRQFERGQCTAEEFADGMVAEWDLSISPAEFLALFNVWPEALFEGSAELVAEVARRVPVGCLSNNNAAHWDKCRDEWGMGDWFTWELLSHEVGMVKPDPEIFAHAIEVVGLPADQILFVDDHPMNVEAALVAGLNAHQVAGPEQTRRVMAHYGLAGDTAAPLTPREPDEPDVD